jgi:hypothetical protein
MVRECWRENEPPGEQASLIVIPPSYVHVRHCSQSAISLFRNLKATTNQNWFYVNKSEVVARHSLKGLLEIPAI